ncbi:fasciclin domain-containing protein [Mucilaginibacter sp. UR6-1]|uniref:fasciclin domain-containing protein n=1 Tax=Mucilaginibacter sp. UR6-1 TaxID=1435643 RepID=UPI001E44545D|nr:fasciclin domain-containing protein [Mucilaginibacter sp. UR6-1]MCC8409463.1 fasciclin domain-containing protein [Mucilaginibacter sp. UR6-1]
MKLQTIYINIIMLIGCLAILPGCTKSIEAIIPTSVSIRYEEKELADVLAGEKNLLLFNQAFNRLALAGQLSANTGYTIFAPTDSAFNAAGITTQSISSMPVKDLQKLITQYIVVAAVDRAALENTITSVGLNTLRQDTIPTANGGTTIRITQLYARMSGSVYLNGDNKGTPKTIIKASNGYIYPVSGLIRPFDNRTLLDAIKSDPDLSLYYEAILIGDSVRQAGLGYDDNSITDINMLKNTGSFMPTILAPTNKAFRDAGFNTVDDIRQFATSGYVGYDLDTFTFFIYSKLDSVLKRHTLYRSGNLSATVRIFYSDLLNPAINNGFYNTYFGPGGSLESVELKYSTPLAFSASGNDAYVKWTDDSSQPILRIPHDAAGSTPAINRNLSNGTLIKIDQLFYPAVK